MTKQTNDSAPTKRARSGVKKANLFTKDLKTMMYAYGDDDSTPDSVAVMEDILTEFLTELCTEAGRTAYPRQKVKVDDFRFVLRRDAKKLGRVEELLGMSKEIANAKKLFDEKEQGD